MPKNQGENNDNLPEETDLLKENNEINQNKSIKTQDDIYIEMFVDKLKTFNDMYKTKVSKDKLASNVSDAWKLLTDESEQKQAEGKKLLNGVFEAMLEHAFEVDKNAAYHDGRFPEYTEIITSSNELLRAAMFAFTDMYRDKSRAQLFEATAFGGMTKDEISKLTAPNDLWKLDQKSDEAWEIQSKEAKEIASEWQKSQAPAKDALKAMNELIEKNNNGTLKRRDALAQLAAAEWLLINDDKMVIEDPNDPYNKTPKWNNRYWKAVTEAREAIGIPKHISIRDLIQGNYAVMQKTMQNENYHKDQIETEIFKPEKRALIDSIDKQKEQFDIQSAKIAENQVPNEENVKNVEMQGTRVRISIVEEDEYLKAKNMPKDMSSFVVEKSRDMNFQIESTK